MRETIKTFVCVCPTGFTGSYCEHHVTSQQLLFLNRKKSFLLNDDGLFLGNTDTIKDDNVRVYESCSTMLHGEAIIIGGHTHDGQQEYEKQVIVRVENIKSCRFFSCIKKKLKFHIGVEGRFPESYSGFNFWQSFFDRKIITATKFLTWEVL